MASVFLSKPGTEFGPCEGNCDHSDCAASRKMAESICTICGKPIGYDKRFFRDSDNPELGEYAHTACYHQL